MAKTPHSTNKRATILDDEVWFGFRAGIFLQGTTPGGYTAGYPAPRTRITLASATRARGSVAARSSRSILICACAAGINHEGINAEVAKEPVGIPDLRQRLQKAADEMWMARYLMQQLTEEVQHRHRISLQTTRRHRLEWLELHASLHLYASQRQGIFRKADEGVRNQPRRHIAVYSPDNHLRLTTASTKPLRSVVQLWHRGPRRLDPGAHSHQ